MILFLSAEVVIGRYVGYWFRILIGATSFSGPKLSVFSFTANWKYWNFWVEYDFGWILTQVRIRYFVWI